MTELTRISKPIPLRECPVCGKFTHYKCPCTHMCRQHGDGTSRRLDCKECQLKGKRGLDKHKLKYTDASGSNPQNPSEGGMLDGVGAAAAATHDDEVWITDLMEESEQPAESATHDDEVWITDLIEESEQPAESADVVGVWITDLMEQSEQPAQSEAAADAGYIWITDLMEEEKSAQPTSLEDMSTEDLEAFLALANQE